MQFTHPYHLYLLISIPFLYLIYRRGIEEKRRAIETFYSSPFIKRYPLVLGGRRKDIRFLFSLISIALLIFALAGPKFGTSQRASLVREGEVIFAIDASLSMTAQDMKPNRFHRAIDEITEVLDGLEGEKVGLIIFASTPIIISPPTQDYEALKVFLDTLDPSTFLDTGTSFERVIERALSLFKDDIRGKLIILFSDGEGDSISPPLLKRLVQKGVKVYTVGIGTEIGAPIPIVMDRGVLSHKRDYQGRAVITRLEESVLKTLSSATQGRYFKALEDKKTAGPLLSQLKEERGPVLEGESIAVYVDRTWYFIFAALTFVIFGIFLPEKEGVRNLRLRRTTKLSLNL